jgi:hypothetical protein
MSEMSDLFLSWAAMGSISLIDVPCGAGAATLALVSTLHELRNQSVLPKLPLNITVHGADVSTDALDHFGAMADLIRQKVISSGISLDWNLTEWDATDPVDTSAFMDNTLAGSPKDLLAIISNFSGTISSLEPFRRSLEHIIERLSNTKAAVVLIEPKMNSSERYFGAIRRLWEGLAFWKSSSFRADEYMLWHPIQDREINCTIYCVYYGREASNARRVYRRSAPNAST